MSKIQVKDVELMIEKPSWKIVAGFGGHEFEIVLPAEAMVQEGKNWVEAAEELGQALLDFAASSRRTSERLAGAEYEEPGSGTIGATNKPPLRIFEGGRKAIPQIPRKEKSSDDRDG